MRLAISDEEDAKKAPRANKKGADNIDAIILRQCR